MNGGAHGQLSLPLLDTFRKIVESKEIWLTNMFCMNDSAEHYWLRRVAQHLLQRRLDVDEAFSRSLASRLFPKEEDTDLYCCCLSYDGDLLGQWRAYADDGRGVAIGLFVPFLAGTRKEYHGAQLKDVLYDRAEQERIVEGIIDPRKDGIDPSTAGKLPAECVDDFLADIAKAELWSCAAQCKNPCFREEREVRLIYHPRPGASDVMGERRFRPRGDMLIPYYALPLPTDREWPVIGEVVFGPKSAHEHDEKVARMVLSESGYNVDRIRFSISRCTCR